MAFNIAKFLICGKLICNDFKIRYAIGDGL